MAADKNERLALITEDVRRLNFAQAANPRKQYLVLYRIKEEKRGNRSYDDRREELIARIRGLDDAAQEHYSTSAWIVYSNFKPDFLASDILGPAIDKEVDAIAVVTTTEKVEHFGANLNLEN